MHREMIRLRIKRASRHLLLALVLCSALSPPSHADDERQSETVPGIDAYVRLSDRFRLFGTASLAQSLSEGVTDGEIGAYLDMLSLNQIFPGPFLDLDWAGTRKGIHRVEPRCYSLCPRRGSL
jgi:hypothetical protein